jgi:fatty-acyl-CoA synthase
MTMRAPYSRNLFDLICEQAERYSDRVAVISGDTRLSYRELERRARSVAAGLAAAGIRKGDRVGLLVSNRAEWIEICFGAAAVGATVVPFSTWSKRRELEFLFTDSAIQALFFVDRVGEQNYAGDVAALMPKLRVKLAVLIGDPYEAFIKNHAPLKEPYAPGDAARAQDDALILYTSGSTSYPKAVPLAQGPMIENGFNIGERQGLRPSDVVLLALPLFWSYGSANAMCATLTHGAALVLQARFEPGEAIELIERHSCTSIYTLPPITAAIIGHAAFRRERTRSLRTGLTIGTPQDVVSAAEELGAREICNVYGQTESYGNCCVTWHHWPLERRKCVSGPPLPGVTVRIVDPENGHALPQGEVGGIEVKGNLMRGYEGTSREQNEKAFTPDGFFRTGDLGRLTAEGDIQFVARDSEMIKRAGINIAPAEVEDVLRQHPGVAEAGVAGAPDPEKGEVIVAFIVAANDAKVNAEELKAHCRKLASSYKTPDRIEFCKVLPVTTTGKLMRKELKQMAAATGERQKVG